MDRDHYSSRFVRPFSDVYVNAGLLIEPIIVRLPLRVRICKSNVEISDDLGDQLVHLAQGNLSSKINKHKMSVQEPVLTFLPMQVREPAPN